MVMLHLIQQVADVPVIHFRAVGQEKKYEFADKVCKEWGIEENTYSPSITGFIAKNGKIDFMRFIPLGNLQIMLASEIHKPVNGNGGCSLLLQNDYPLEPTNSDYDLIFNGHRGDDVDPLWGDVTLVKDRFKCKGTTMFYPLKNWTSQDIWDYTEKHKVPYNDKRYNREDGYREFKDKTYNENFHYACTECINPDNPQSVYCKWVEGEAPNISDKMMYAEKEDFCRKIIKNVKLEVHHA